MAKALSIVSNMQANRETARQVWGVEYATNIEPWKDQLREWAEAKQLPLMKALLEMSQSARDGGYPGAVIFLSAATLDLIAEGYDG